MNKSSTTDNVTDNVDHNIADLLAQLDQEPITVHKSDLITPKEEISITPEKIDPPVTPAIDISKHVKSFETISSEVLGSWRADRQEAQSAANLIRDLIEDAIMKGISPNGTWLEAYVAAIKVKSDTNANVTKILDATVRLMQLSKPNVIKQTTNNTLHYKGLSQILSDPIRDDDV